VNIGFSVLGSLGPPVNTLKGNRFVMGAPDKSRADSRLENRFGFRIL
jgi:hypothetical protein